MTPTKNKKQVHKSIDLVNYYKYMWVRRSHLLHPLTALTPSRLKFKWTDVEQKAFYEIKHIVAQIPYWHTRISINVFISILMLAITR